MQLSDTMMRGAGTMTMRRRQIKFLTVIPEPKPVLTREEAGRYKWVEYAGRNFSRHVEKGLFKKEKVLTPEEMSQYSKKLDSPLHALRTPELSRLACELYSRMVAYVEEKARPLYEQAQFVLAKGLANEELRDEIFAQMVKLTQNPKREQALRGWELLNFACGTFPPSENCLRYLAAYLIEHAGTAEPPARGPGGGGGGGGDEIALQAQFALRRLNRVAAAGRRLMVPGLQELAAVRDRKPIMCRFDFPDSNKKAMYIDSQTTSKEVFGILAQKIGLKDPCGYAIYECYNNLERSLNENDNLADAIAKFERFESDCRAKGIRVQFRFMFKRKVFLDPRVMPEDPVERSLMFYQAYNDLISGRLPCSEREAVQLAGLKLQIDYGDRPRETREVPNLPQLVPKTLWAQRSAEEWQRELLQAWSACAGRTREQSKEAFLEQVMQLDLYGYTLFQVQHKSDWQLPFKFDIAIGKGGILFLNEHRQPAYSFSLDQVDNMYYTPKSFKLFLNTAPPGTLPSQQQQQQQHQKQIELQTLQGIELASLISEYQYWLDQESQWARATRDYITDDYSLLSFRAGDLIFIISKDDSGWYTGEVHGKQGLFPCDHVQVLLSPPPEVAAKLGQAGAPGWSGRALVAGGGGGGSGGSGGSQRGRADSRRSRRPSMLLTDARLRAGSRAGQLDAELPTTKQFNMAKFAEQFFRKTEAKRQTSLMATLKRSGGGAAAPLDITARLSYSREPIQESLLLLEDPAANRAAVEMFQNVQRYLEDRGNNPRARTKLVQAIIGAALQMDELRNELYCQLIKQTTGNPRPESTLRGWELVCLCLGCFLPTKNFMNYLLAYINDHKTQPDEVGQLARDCLERAQRTQSKGARKRPPGSEELAAVLSHNKIVVRVYFLDGTSKAVYIDSATTVQEILSDIRGKFNLSPVLTDPWSLYEVAPAIDYERPLREVENVCDLMAGWELFEKPKNLAKDVIFSLVFKKKVFMDPRRFEPEDSILFSLLYAQTADNVLKGKYPASIDTAVQLGGLVLQAAYGDYGPGQVALNESTLSKFVPQPLLSQRMATDWIKQLSASWQKNAGKSERAAKRAYLEKVSEWELYGSAVFYARQKAQPNDIALAINRDGIHILDRTTKQILKSHPYNSISNWSPSESAFTIIAGSLVKPMRLVFETHEAIHMSELFQAYIDALVLLLPLLPPPPPFLSP
jgi:hypothetical protein